MRTPAPLIQRTNRTDAAVSSNCRSAAENAAKARMFFISNSYFFNQSARLAGIISRGAFLAGSPCVRSRRRTKNLMSAQCIACEASSVPGNEPSTDRIEGIALQAFASLRHDSAQSDAHNLDDGCQRHSTGFVRSKLGPKWAAVQTLM